MGLYRLRKETVGVHREAARHVAIAIPCGAIVRSGADIENATGFVPVEWEGKAVELFAVDLRDRGEAISVRTAASAG